MSKETKIGLLAAIVIGVTIWGLKFLKGQNILSNNRTFYVEYNDVSNLKPSTPVTFNGLEVGVIKDIYPHKTNSFSIIVELNIDRPLRIPKNAKAVQFNSSMMGSKAIKLMYDKPCSGGDCAESEEYLDGDNLGLLQSIVPKEDVKDYVDNIGSGISTAFDSISAKVKDSDANDQLSKSLNDIQMILSNLVSTTSKLDQVVAESSGNMKGVMSNLDVVTSNFAKNNDHLNSIIRDFATISKEIKEAGVGSTITKTQTTMKDANGAINELQATLKKANSSFDKLSIIMTKLEKGEGTLGKLMNDKELYENLEGTSNQLELLLQDFRLNPKRYVNVSVFGKKQKKYEVPEDDPAEELEEE